MGFGSPTNQGYRWGILWAVREGSMSIGVSSHHYVSHSTPRRSFFISSFIFLQFFIDGRIDAQMSAQLTQAATRRGGPVGLPCTAISVDGSLICSLSLSLIDASYSMSL